MKYPKKTKLTEVLLVPPLTRLDARLVIYGITGGRWYILVLTLGVVQKQHCHNGNYENGHFPHLSVLCHLTGREELNAF